eukprot:CAMPEP_0172393092 /NCGR_PEP_ID=MMETSP1061-20121228/9049_1 /TAXON_ID=37318 /ORGANISM="Pseudo-nitzschia pungens, Strain cf. pungens" /LENGTH=740 /DNA_ID=CAMNT_0013124071 /DNA_START=133 /DNA_END=2355 /DNA_ORIENTATION=-
MSLEDHNHNHNTSGGHGDGDGTTTKEAFLRCWSNDPIPNTTAATTAATTGTAMQRKRHRRGYRHVRASLLFSFLVALSFQLITIREWDTGAIQYQILSRGELEDTWFLKEFRAPATTKKETAKKRPTKGFARGTAHYSKKHTHKSGGEDGVGVGVGVGSESKSKSQAVLELELESELESESDSRPDAAKNKGKQRKDKKDKKEKRVVGSEKKEEKPADDDAQKGAEESNEAKLDDDKTNEQENDKEKEKTSTEQQQQQQQQEEEEEEEDAMVDDDMYFRDPGAPIADWDYYPKRKPRRDPSWSKSSSKKQAPPDKARCKRLMQTIDTSPPPRRQPSGKACKGYNGVFHIHHFDRGGASGTAFFLFTIGMLSWAEQHNFVPWIHIEDGYTEPIWDPLVHNNTNTNTNTNTKSSNNDSNNDSNSNSGAPRTFRMMAGMEIGWARDKRDARSHIFPGAPVVPMVDDTGDSFHLRPETFVVSGTGVWEHYFLPPNDFVPGDASCKDLPLVKMSNDHIVPGIHANAPYAPRAWRVTEAPYLTQDHLSWDDWFKPQREHGARMTKRYIRFTPAMEDRANCAFPDPEFSLGMHIRHGDKQDRAKISTDKFLEYAKAFVEHGGGAIYVATDSIEVVNTIRNQWPRTVADHVVRQSFLRGLTPNETAAFDMGVSAHRTNIEAMTDILALSKSTFFLHGLSAMSEAVFYLNPELEKRSINLEDDDYHGFTPEHFATFVMPRGRRKNENKR